MNKLNMKQEVKLQPSIRNICNFVWIFRNKKQMCPNMNVASYFVNIINQCLQNVDSMHIMFEIDFFFFKYSLYVESSECYHEWNNRSSTRWHSLWIRLILFQKEGSGKVITCLFFPFEQSLFSSKCKSFILIRKYVI